MSRDRSQTGVMPMKPVLPATESTDRATGDARQVDVLVIGGGPAGSCAAMALAKAGRSVVVIEKEQFPRYHIGESLLPYNGPIFEQLGLKKKLSALNPVVKRGAQFFDGSGARSVRFDFSRGRFNEHHQACHVERAAFDAMLLEHAHELGAQIHQRTRVAKVSQTADGSGSLVETRPSGPETGGDCEQAATIWRARFVIDASGLAAVTAVHEGVKQPFEGHRRVALFAQYSGVLMEACEEEKGDIILVRFDDGWAWFIPLDGERVSVGIVIDQPIYRSMGLAPGEAFNRLAASIPEVARRLACATRFGEIRSAADYSFSTRRLIGPRLIRAGDAAGFLDPIFSSGVMLAMKSGLEAGRCADEAITRDHALTRAMRRYERRTQAHMKRFWKLIEAYYSPAFLEVLLCPNPPLQLPSGVGAILVGRDRLPWGARWRLALFYLVVRLQRSIPLVPRLEDANCSAPDLLEAAVPATQPHKT